MSIINKFGVPTPSSNRRTMTQPKPKNKFRLAFFGFNNQNDGVGSEVVVQETNTVDLPKVTYSSQRMFRYDTDTSYITRRTWEPITLTVRDSIDTNLLRSINGQLQKANNYTRRMSVVSKESQDYKFEMYIQIMTGSEKVGTLDKVGGILEDVLNVGSNITNGIANGSITDTIMNTLNTDTFDYFQGTICTWVLEGCVITDADYGDMDYSESSFNNISLTIKPDNVYVVDATGTPIHDGSFTLSDVQAIIDNPSSVFDVFDF